MTADEMRGCASAVQGVPGATGLQSSLGRAEEDEGDEAKPMRVSPEHERWQ
jgi:hypothetical protein